MISHAFTVPPFSIRHACLSCLLPLLYNMLF
jgi:hypothetical protein